MATTLLSNQTIDGSGSGVAITDGGFKFIQIRGTFDGATVTIDVSFDDGTTWAASSASAVTAEDTIYFQVKSGIQIRATVSSAGGSTDIDADFV